MKQMNKINRNEKIPLMTQRLDLNYPLLACDSSCQMKDASLPGFVA